MRPAESVRAASEFGGGLKQIMLQAQTTGGETSGLLSTSEAQPSYLIQGRNRSYIRLSPSAYHLLQSINSGISYSALAERLSGQQGRAVSAEEVETAHLHVLKRVEEIERKAGGTPSGFWFHIELLSEKTVGLIARPLSVAFRMPVTLPLLGVIGVAVWLVASNRMLVNVMPYLTQYPETFWKGYGLFMLSLIFHEFGHASACARYGATTSGIGFTTYLIYPALYSDVSAAWHLKCRQRVVVDVGGVFFQLVVGAVYVFLYALYGWNSFRVAALMILANCLFSMNPILKFDGYWIVADALGVTNLSQQPQRILRYVSARLRGREVAKLPWKPAVTAVLSVYTFVSLTFWLYFLLMLAPLLWRLLAGYPQQAADFFSPLFKTGTAPSGASLHTFFVSTYMIFIMLFITTRMFKPLLVAGANAAWRLLRRGLGRPRTSDAT